MSVSLWLLGFICVMILNETIGLNMLSEMIKSKSRSMVYCDFTSIQGGYHNSQNTKSRDYSRINFSMSLYSSFRNIGLLER